MSAEARAEGPGFATRLRELRRERGLRQRDLADALGVAQTTIANYEQNTRFPDEATLRAIARYFLVSFDDLLGRPASAGPQPAPLGAAARAYLDRLMSGDDPGAWELLEVCVRGNPDTRPVYLEVLQPCLYEVGRLWETGAIDVGEEHRISHLVDRHMSELRFLARDGGRADGRRYVCMAAHGDTHLLGARVVADFLELDGWRGGYLGGNLSLRHTLAALEEARPDMLALSATVPQALHSLSDLITSLRARPALRTMRVLVGGQAFNQEPGLWTRVGADAWAPDAAQAVVVARRLVSVGVSSPEGSIPPGPIPG